MIENSDIYQYLCVNLTDTLNEWRLEIIRVE